MGNVLIERTTESTPFLTTGVDFIGQVYVRPFRKYKETKKVYVCFFICPEIGLFSFPEIVSFLAADTFILALERLIASKQDVRVLMSDNGTNFTKTAHLLSDLKRCPRLAALLANK